MLSREENMSDRWGAEKSDYYGGTGPRKSQGKPSWMTKDWEQKKALEAANMKVGRFTPDVVKAKLAIKITSLKSICKKMGIQFSDDKVFSQVEYDAIKRVVVKLRNAGKL